MPCHPDRVRRNYPELKQLDAMRLLAAADAICAEEFGLRSIELPQPRGYHAGDVQVPHFTDDDTIDNPPRADDVWDQLPILERGWNVIEGETD